MKSITKKLFISGFISVLFLIFLISFVSAEENSIVNKIADSINGLKEKKFMVDSIGFLKGAFKLDNSSVGYFGIGFLAGFWMWITYFVIRVFRGLKDGFTPKVMVGKDEDEIKESRTRWLALVAGRIWKIPLIAIIFAVIMQIPGLNRVVQVLTLEVFNFHGFWRSFIIAFEIGFLPTFIEAYKKTRIRTKLEKKVTAARKGSAISQGMS